MAVSSISGSSSIYGTRNVISGLASGMDTESMIENAVSAYKTKISSLNQKRTKVVWQQEAYRSMINKMSSFLSKYTSYQSTNNLMSLSFWNQSVNTVAKGANASKISAVGKSSSNVQIDRVLQLATSATYKLSGSALDRNTSAFDEASVSAAASDVMDLDGEVKVSGLTGSLTLAYGGINSQTKLKINFDDTTLYEGETDTERAQALVDEINRQLETQSVTIGSTTYTGKDLTQNVVRAELKDGKITFADPKGNNVYVSAASGDASALLGGKTVSSDYSKQVRELTVSTTKVQNMLKTETKGTLDYLKDKSATMNITVDGVTKSIRMPTASDLKDADGNEITDPQERDAAYVKALQDKIDSAFGKGKLTVSDKNGSAEGIQLNFEVAKGSTFTVSSSQGKALGFGESGQVTSYLNTGKTLGEFLSDDELEEFATGKTDKDGNKLYSFKVNGVEIGQFTKDTTLDEIMNTMNSNSESGVSVSYSKLTNELTFTAKDTGAASEIKFDGLAAKLFGSPGTYDDDGRGTYTKGQDAIFEASVNGTSLGQMTRSSNSVNIDGMTVTLKGTFGYETDENGNTIYDESWTKDAAGRYVFNYGDGKTLYGTDNGDNTMSIVDASGKAFTYQPSDRTSEYYGQKVYGKFNSETGQIDFYVKSKESGEEKQVYLRENGTVTVNGSQAANVQADVTRTARASATEAVTFETSSDADKLVDLIKQMIDDYNEMVTEIKNAYSTLPAQKSNGTYYEPLTEEEEEGQTESFIKNWNEKAQQGILFGDNDLRSLYSRLTEAISMGGELGATLRAAGITVNYSDGLSTLSFDEDKFRTALENDPDKVRDAFISTTSNGASENGLMQALKVPLEMYGKTSGGKGILVEKAGSPLAASTLYSNSIQTQLNNIDTQIEKWQNLMSNQIDYYTKQFSRLEQLVQQMNSQSSYFSQLTGY